MKITIAITPKILPIPLYLIKDLFDIIKHEKKEYSDNVSIVQDALMKGLEEIKNTI